MSNPLIKGPSGIERCVWIARKFRAGARINCSLIAKRFEVTTKTAQRDLDFMQDRLRYELEYVKNSHTYRLIKAPEAVL